MSELFLRLVDKIIEEQGVTKETKKLLEAARKMTEAMDEEKKLREQYESLPIQGQDEWLEVGEVGVDAGMVWMGDPCYILALPHCRKPSEEKKQKMIKDGSWENLKSLYEETKELPKNLGESWHGFCDKMHDDSNDPIFGYGSQESIAWYKEQIKKGFRKGQEAIQFNYDLGHPGLGVCMGSGYGDGSYPVYVKRNSEGRITEAKIVFISDYEEEEEENE